MNVPQLIEYLKAQIEEIRDNPTQKGRDHQAVAALEVLDEHATRIPGRFTEAKGRGKAEVPVGELSKDSVDGGSGSGDPGGPEEDPGTSRGAADGRGDSEDDRLH